METVVGETSIGQLPHEPVSEIVVQQTEEIAPKLAEEPTVPTESTMSKEEVPTTKQQELDEQRQATEPQAKA